MTTYTRFAPTAAAPFQFQTTLDGALYNVVVTWNTFGQRWYINIYDQTGNLALCRALVESPSGVPIESASWQSRIVTVLCDGPHGYILGSTVNLMITGLQPAAYNGNVFAFITGPATFTYPLVTNPGAATVQGGQCFMENYNISLTKGYFASTLVFRDATQTFEVSP